MIQIQYELYLFETRIMKTVVRDSNNTLDDSMKEIGQLLKIIRINDGLTQEAVHEEYMLNRSLLSRAERGKPITLKSFLKILEVYDYNLKSFGFLINEGSILGC